MALFKKGITKAAISQDEPKVQAAAGGTYYTGNGSGAQSIGEYYSYIQGTQRDKAMQVGTINRSRDLIASVLASTPLCMYRRRWDDVEKEMVDEPIAPRSWLHQPDPQLSYSAFMSWVLDDLMFFGRCFLWVSSRTSDGLPASFTRLPAAMVNTLDMSGPVFAFGKSNEIYFQGAQLPTDDVIQIIGGNQGILYQSEQIIATSLALEQARLRNASSALPAGVLRTTGEPLSSQELSDLAQSFEQARKTNQIAAINQFVEWQPTDVDASKMMLNEAAEYQSKEAARMCNVPFFLNGNSIGSYSYQSNQGARMDLLVFAARSYMLAIEQTLSMNNVLPQGTIVKFDVESYLSEMVAGEMGEYDDPEEMNPPQTPTMESN
jgi:hypothetical protein